jgi:hypothetical protein
MVLETRSMISRLPVPRFSQRRDFSRMLLLKPCPVFSVLLFAILSSVELFVHLMLV